MGCCCSTPSPPCRSHHRFPLLSSHDNVHSCEEKCSLCLPSTRHIRNCKRIKYSLLPQRDPAPTSTSFHPRIGTQDNNDTVTDTTVESSPTKLQRSNAIRRTPGRYSCSRPPSRRSSPSPDLHPDPVLSIRDTTPPPQRPTSIVPTPRLVLNTTPSTNSRSLVTATNTSRGTTSPITFATSPYTPYTPQTLTRSTTPATPITRGTLGHSASRDETYDRPRTAYVLNDEVISPTDDSPRLELRWIDALRAPGAPGGYRTVVDVVEEKRSGRLTVVNGRERDESAEGEEVRRVSHDWTGRETNRGRIEREMEMSGVERGCSRRGCFEGNFEGKSRDLQRPMETPKRQKPLRSEPATPTRGPKVGRPYASLPPSPIRVTYAPPPTFHTPPRPNFNTSTPPRPLNFYPPPVVSHHQAILPPRQHPRPPHHPAFSPPPHHAPQSHSHSDEVSTPPHAVRSTYQPPLRFQRRQRPMGRGPIPTFTTPKELLQEVEEARKIIDSKQEGRRKDQKTFCSDEEMMDWFWIDDYNDGGEGAISYWHGPSILV